MFDISFTELVVIGIVALVVIGPERLPGVARTLGHLLGRAQRYVSDVKADIQREIQLEELKKLQAQVTEAAGQLQDNVRQEIDSARAAFVSPAESALAELEQTARQTIPLPAAGEAAAAPTAEGTALPAALPANPDQTKV